MPKDLNNWYAITGAPSSGKSTLLSELENRGCNVSKDMARALIDENLVKGVSVEELRANVSKFQLDILKRKVKIEEKLDAKIQTFFDCGIHDTLAFLKLHGIKTNKDISNIVEKAGYKKVFLLQPLEKYKMDYARTESEDEALRLNDLLYEAYDKHGMTPVLVPPSRVEQRADLIFELL